MLFTELRFFGFFALVLLVHWALRSDRVRKLWLLLASYAFYAAWDWRFLSLIVFSTALDFAVGLGLGRAAAPGRRRLLLVASLVGNLGMLAVFKYLNFFLESAGALARALGAESTPRALAIVLPVGISFYTFQTLSYTIDVYRGSLKPTRNLADFALFVGFFPQLVAGPIVRAADFLPQLRGRRSLSRAEARAALALFLVGFVKKACVSDNVAPAVDAVFADPGAFGSGALWLSTALYSVQIYCDFSGYSDMAIASAALLGYRLPLNFDFPYLRRSITGFWRGWHVSLSSWFRDYLYLPLGGNRRGRARTYRNLVVVFLLCGLWHGASWSFVLWGAWHGAFLVLERAALGPAHERLPALLGRAYVALAVMVGWVLFRAPDLGAAGTHLRGMFRPTAGAAVERTGMWLLLLAGLAAAHVLARRRVADRVRALPDWAWAAAFGAAVALVLPWVAGDYQAFIYFQF